MSNVTYKKMFNLFSEVFPKVPLGIQVLEEHEVHKEDLWPYLAAWVVTPPRGKVKSYVFKKVMLCEVSLTSQRAGHHDFKVTGQVKQLMHGHKASKDTFTYQEVTPDETLYGLSDVLGWLSEVVEDLPAESRWLDCQEAVKVLLPHVWEDRVLMPETCVVAHKLFDLFGTSMWSANYPFSFVHPSMVTVRNLKIEDVGSFTLEFLRVGDPQGMAIVTKAHIIDPKDSRKLARRLRSIEKVSLQLKMAPWVADAHKGTPIFEHTPLSSSVAEIPPGAGAQLGR